MTPCQAASLLHRAHSVKIGCRFMVLRRQSSFARGTMHKLYWATYVPLRLVMYPVLVPVFWQVHSPCCSHRPLLLDLVHSQFAACAPQVHTWQRAAAVWFCHSTIQCLVRCAARRPPAVQTLQCRSLLFCDDAGTPYAGSQAAPRGGQAGSLHLPALPVRLQLCSVLAQRAQAPAGAHGPAHLPLRHPPGRGTTLHLPYTQAPFDTPQQEPELQAPPHSAFCSSCNMPRAGTRAAPTALAPQPHPSMDLGCPHVSHAPCKQCGLQPQV